MGSSARVIIIAAGDGKRWDNHLGVTKHMAPVLDEPIIHRTCRLLHQRTPIRDVWIAGTNPEYVKYDAQLSAPRGYEEARGGAKKFLDSQHLWNPDGRTIVMYGDVFFTHEAIDTITTFDGDDWTLFCRFGRSKLTGSGYGECFAQSFLPEHQPEHLAKLKYVATLYAQRAINRCGGWEHYRAMSGKLGAEVRNRSGANARLGRAIEIDDWTDDFDWPADHFRFNQRYWKAHTCPS